MFERLWVVVLLVAMSSCSRTVETKFELKSHLLLSSKELARTGFDAVDPSHLIMLVEDKIYLISNIEGILVRFSKEGKAERLYVAKGQGPGEFQNPRNIFRYDPETIAVFDMMKSQLLLFDNDLNFKKSIDIGRKEHEEFYNVMRSGSATYAFGSFKGNYLALLKNDLRVEKKFRKIPTIATFKHIYPRLLYAAYLLNDSEIAATSWMYFSEHCKVDIIDANTQQINTSLSWESPVSPTQEDVTARRNLYACLRVLKAGHRYVVETEFKKEENQRHRQFELIVFDENGTYLTQMKTLYVLITTNEEHGSRIYFVDEKDNVCYWEVGENWPWK